MANERLPRSVRRLFRLPWRTAANIAKDVDEELRFHVEMRAAELMASGLDAESATAEAWRSFGNPSAVREHAIAVNAGPMRRARAVEMIASVVQDVRFALRQARRTPLFTLVAVATLALGIGANTAIFSVVHHLLVAPFPFEDSSRLVWITAVDVESNTLIVPDAQAVEAWRARAHSLEAISTIRDNNVELRDGQRVETIKGAAMSATLLPMLGVRPVLGRGFERSDERRGAAPVAMLGYEEWQTRFSGRSDVIGQTITVDSFPRVIVGVAPPGFVVPFAESATPMRVWLPLADSGHVFAIGKVRKGVAMDVVNRELTTIAAQVPGALWGKQTVRVWREQDLWGWLTHGIMLLFAAVGVVLLISCANVANLSLVRAWSRQREFAIRTALGAGRTRLARQLVAECLTIAIAGGAAGLALAWASVRMAIKLRPPNLDVLDQVRIEPAALGWTMLITLGTGVVFGFAPAVFATARGMNHRLNTGARDTEGRSGARVFRSSIIVAEIALSVVLLVAAGLLVRSFRAMENVDLGFEPSGLSAVTVGVGRAIAPSHRRAMVVAFLQRLRETPGIHGAVFAGSLPPTIFASGEGLQPLDGPSSDAPRFPSAGSIDVQPGFFKTAGIRVRGRTFDMDSTGMDSLPPNEIIINERLARRLWPDVDAIGQRVRVGKTTNTVIGVANDLTLPGESGDQSDLQVYTPWFALNVDEAKVVFRSELGDRGITAAVHQAMRSVSPQLSIVRSETSDERLRMMVAPMKFATALVSGFALIALLLAVVGLYGVIAYAVSQRTREIGVRIALGAQPQDIARLVLIRGAALVGVGLLGGLMLSLAGTRLLNAYLYGVAGRDPVTYAAITVLLGAAALFAAYLPARRAMRVDPVVALSAE